MTLLNAPKPLQIDDSALYYYAAQIAEKPLDPFGFRVFWYDEPEPANHVLTPPVVPYWWALAVRFFGEQPILWKLWMLPFPLLFVFALHALLRRFARGLQIPLLILTAFSPAILPSINLMLDIPAISLSLCAVAVFLRAADRNSLGLALLAGLLAGVATQTKYTAFLTPGVILLYALMFSRLRLGVAATAVIGLVFVSWEVYTARCYDRSHFLYSLSENYTTFVNKAFMSFPAMAYLGGTAPALSLLAFCAAGFRPKTIWAVSGVYILGFFLLACLPGQVLDFHWHVGTYRDRLRVGDVVASVFGTIFLAGLTAVLLRLCHCGRGRFYMVGNWRQYRVEWFLFLWLLWEIVGYYALSPFPAVRRVLGMLLVTTLLTGRLASWTCRTPSRRVVVWGIVAFGALLGLGFYAIDFLDAAAQKRAAADVAVLPAQAGNTRWFIGHWGFQHYAEGAGMRPVVPGQTELHRGDLLAVPQKNLAQQSLLLPADKLELEWTMRKEDAIPLRTVPGFYGGRLPINHKEGARLTVRVYRVLEDFCTATAPATDEDKDE